MIYSKTYDIGACVSNTFCNSKAKPVSLCGMGCVALKKLLKNMLCCLRRDIPALISDHNCVFSSATSMGGHVSRRRLAVCDAGILG